MKERLEDHIPPPILIHVNDKIAPPVVTLSITVYEFMDISSSISAVHRGKGNSVAMVPSGCNLHTQ
eukprot:12888232-Prorocentrum_lima.AAC.1